MLTFLSKIFFHHSLYNYFDSELLTSNEGTSYNKFKKLHLSHFKSRIQSKESKNICNQILLTNKIYYSAQYTSIVYSTHCNLILFGVNDARNFAR